jgi:hypothetical protein
MLEAIQNTAFADWVRVSEWGYPIILTLHSLGLALVVGVLIVMDLRILGVPKSLPLLPLKQLMTLVWIGFTVNLLTGLALFSADAVKFFHSPTFRFKIASVVAGVVFAVFLRSSVFGAGDGFDRGGAVIPVRAKVVAVLSIAVWLAAIGLGRYVAYE